MIGNIEEARFLIELGVSPKALEILTSNGGSMEEVREDLKKLKEIYLDMPEDISGLPEEFKTYLWTLLGEISIPNNLGEDIPESWPVLIFPFACGEECKIEDYISSYGFFIKKRENIVFSEVLHGCLYGGQAWFDSLRYALGRELKPWDKEALLLWMAKGAQGRCSIGAMARKLQLQLRPTMVSYNVKSDELLYPGIIRAFHTPHLGNVAIHSAIFKLEEWKC